MAVHIFAPNVPMHLVMCRGRGVKCFDMAWLPLRMSELCEQSAKSAMRCYALLQSPETCLRQQSSKLGHCSNARHARYLVHEKAYFSMNRSGPGHLRALVMLLHATLALDCFVNRS